MAPFFHACVALIPIFPMDIASPNCYNISVTEIMIPANGTERV